MKLELAPSGEWRVASFCSRSESLDRWRPFPTILRFTSALAFFCLAAVHGLIEDEPFFSMSKNRLGDRVPYCLVAWSRCSRFASSICRFVSLLSCACFVSLSKGSTGCLARSVPFLRPRFGRFDFPIREQMKRIVHVIDGTRRH